MPIAIALGLSSVLTLMFFGHDSLASLSLKLYEFVETYGITSVIPVRNPHDTAEPELLGMSPEQAEETTAKLRELETELLLRRQEAVSSVSCFGLVISRKKDSIPEHLRVWEMTIN